MPNFLSVPEYYTTKGAYVKDQFDVYQTGETEVALGKDANAEGNHDVAIGTEASAPNDSGVAVEYRANARDDYCVSIGANSGSEGPYSISIGADATAQAPDGGSAVQIGANTVTYSSINIGNKSLIDLVYPVGSIYMSVNNTAPHSLFGGTWVSWGVGRVPVGVDTNDSDFLAAEKMGGTKQVSVPYHSHELFFGSIGASGVDAFVGGDASSLQPQDPYNSEDGYLFTIGRTDSRYESNKVAKTASYGATNVSNLQPYITCYMWKRTE